MKFIFKKEVYLLIIAITLLSLNIAGLFITLRNSDIYDEEQTYFINDIIYTEKQLHNVVRRTNEPDKAYVTRINQAISNGIAHYWKDAGMKKYNIRIPIYENYILYFAGHLFPKHFKRYEFSNYKRAIERGVGLCSQHSIILAEVLEKNGVDAKIIGLSCHVVVMAQVNKDNDTWWILDPDFGVTINKNIDEIEKSPEIIQSYYIDKGYNETTVSTVTNCYRNINGIYEDAYSYSGWKRYYIEKFSYIIIWIIPLLLLLASIKLYSKK